MGKEVREISRFFVAPPRMFAPAVWASFTHFLTHKYLHALRRPGRRMGTHAVSF